MMMGKRANGEGTVYERKIGPATSWASLHTKTRTLAKPKQRNSAAKHEKRFLLPGKRGAIQGVAALFLRLIKSL